MKKIYFLLDGWGGSTLPWDDVEDNNAPGWPTKEDENKKGSVAQ